MLSWLHKLALLLLINLLSLASTLAATAPPPINANGAILMDSTTGQVLFEKNAYQPLAPASTTKIMTAILAIESGRLDEKTTISQTAANTPGSSMHLEAGQVISLRELLTGLMLRSGNDGAIAIAETIAGSVDDFVILMNNKAAAIGAYQTYFCNPHGLSAPGHRSTAFDLAWLTRYAMNNATFAEIVNTKHSRIDWKDSRGTEHERSLKNTNKLLWMLEEADGVKTGTTNEAGPCLVSSATKNNQQLIAVTLHDATRWQDSQALLEWGFANFPLFEYAQSGATIGEVRVENGLSGQIAPLLTEPAAMILNGITASQIDVVIDLPTTIKAPVYQGQKIGELNFNQAGKTIKTFDLVAAADIEEKTIVRLLLRELTNIFKYFADLGLI